VRTRIATDLHDDIGASLSQIAVLSQAASRQAARGSTEAKGSLERITDLSGNVVDAMSDVVWSINPARDRMSDLVHRMRRFAVDLFADGDTAITLDLPEDADDARLDPDVRRQIYLVFKEALRNVDGSDSLHPNRSGDVVVITRPPYQSDAGANGQVISLSHFFGQHGFEPNYVDLANNINMHATFVLGGPGVEKKDNFKGLRAIDVAPTLAFLMDIPGPQNARGRILYDAVEGTNELREVTILDVSDFHGQLIPLSEAADNLAAPAVNAAFPIGGSAFLKKYFELYEAEAALADKNAGDQVIEMMAGDSVGATPPISNSFGDTPTMEVMNMMGIDIDGLGNHNFDRGADYLRNTLIPIANFPYVSSNVVDAAGNTPAEWSKSYVFDVGHGVKVGFVGFTNDDASTLTKPGSFDPFPVPLGNPIDSVNAEAARIDDLFDNLNRSADRDAVVELAFDSRWHFPAYVRTVALPVPDAWAIIEARALRRSTPE